MNIIKIRKMSDCMYVWVSVQEKEQADPVSLHFCKSLGWSYIGDIRPVRMNALRAVFRDALNNECLIDVANFCTGVGRKVVRSGRAVKT